MFNGNNTLDQLVKILRILGCPKWNSLSYVKQGKRDIPMIPDFKKLGLESLFTERFDRQLVALIKKMLAFEPRERITAI